jgi:hypothetical protein
VFLVKLIAAQAQGEGPRSLFWVISDPDELGLNVNRLPQQGLRTIEETLPVGLKRHGRGHPNEF